MNTNSNKDEIYADTIDNLGKFQFDEQVAQVFADMIKRSVPGYAMILQMISLITQRYARSNTLCYDLGSSLGASTFAMQQALEHMPDLHDVRIIAVDNSSAMIEKCQALLDQQSKAKSAVHVPIELHCQDVLNTSISNASLVTMNFTLQFIEAHRREEMLSRIYNGLIPGGALILSEKIAIANEYGQNLLIDLHHGFKKQQGYSELEVAQKRTALENVLVPDSLNTHSERLRKAGFKHIQPWFQCFNFVSLIAVK